MKRTMINWHWALTWFGLMTIAVNAHAQNSQEDDMAAKVKSYAKVRLTTDLSKLTPAQQQMIPLLIDAAIPMDHAFWIQAYGDRTKLVSSILNQDMREYANINYGPWDRLNDNKPFVPGVGPKPLGANFYPQDLTKEEFESYIKSHPLEKDALTDLYTMVRRTERGTLDAIPYSIFFRKQIRLAATKLKEASFLAKDPGLKKYLDLRSKAMQSNSYRDSDMAWMDMKNNIIDVVIGPIETYEDRLFGYKAAFEAYVLVKDKAWSDRLAKYATLLPGLQKDLPVGDAYKAESPGSNSDLNAYDVIYYAGDCNAGSKTIAINLPNDEVVQEKKGSRRLQLKNAMRAKFDRILVPISEVLISPEQRKHITFDAFFSNTMFHEVAHGLGIKNTINGKGTVREALKEQHSALEEGKADVLGLYMVSKLYEQGVLTTGDVKDNYVTFLASIFRSVRFGASSAHGKANMIRFNYFKEMGAFTRSSDTGHYRANFGKMKIAVDALSERILLLQGDGDYDAVVKFMKEMGKVGTELQSDLRRLSKAGIPVDIVFEQGMSVLTPPSSE